MLSNPNTAYIAVMLTGLGVALGIGYYFFNKYTGKYDQNGR